MNIAILGYGLEGSAAYDYWRGGNDITVRDRNEGVVLPEGVASRLGADYLADLSDFDLIVRSPHVHPRDIVTANTPEILQKVTSNVNEFLKVSPTKNIIGVTGTKGKGTTSTLITKMLEAAGKRVHLGGNIGIPALNLLKEDIKADDWVVLELSSFQLIDLQTSPHIAVCLMVTPEHLDWHADEAEYLTAKSRLFLNQGSDDIAIYYVNNAASELLVSRSAGHKIPYFAVPGATIDNQSIAIDDQVVCKTDELKLLGEHNWQNVCAAVTAVWQITQDVDALRSVLTSFAGLEHRLELVREVAGVKYYDDSFGTTPETAIVALQAFDAPKVIILGGSGKGASYDKLAQVVASSEIRKVLLIGEQAAALQNALGQAGFNNFAPGGASMPEIVETARQAAQAGDVVLLSPACASFDMFASYKDRGEQFKLAVQALA
ncbi:MAG: UDP-N-acetylmuramoylalanine--D-glutamate ligase [Candidatus Saccharibacteria bacterium]|nr:UDP-N-acetylmuramoylalanine--D-glutamate ligase [Candidatus Saccharibacteria bacterium]